MLTKLFAGWVNLLDCLSWAGREPHQMESALHELLKGAALNELERKGYNLYLEPSEPPLRRLSWSYYRPDILGFLSNETESMLVLVECEANPRIRRMKRKVLKIRRSLTFQKRLNEKYNLRLLLVIPSGMLRRVNNHEIRRLWEIWIVNHRGMIIHKIPSKECTKAA